MFRVKRACNGWAYRYEPGDEVLTSPLTCTATNWPALANGDLPCPALTSKEREGPTQLSFEHLQKKNVKPPSVLDTKQKMRSSNKDEFPEAVANLAEKKLWLGLTPP